MRPTLLTSVEVGRWEYTPPGPHLYIKTINVEALQIGGNKFIVGDIILCVNNEPLEGNEIAPPLTLGTEYKVQGFILDSKGNQHLDVGIQSRYTYIRSWETKEELPKGDRIHWCHPSRFDKVEIVETRA